MIKELDQGHLIAVTMEEGIANIFAITNHKTLHKAKIEKTVTKNKGTAASMKHA